MSIEFILSIYQITALMFITMLLFFQYFSKKKEEKKELIKEASQFIKKWNDPEFIRISTSVFRKELRDEIREDYKNIDMSLKKEDFDNLITILNFFEELAISVENNIADEKILKLYFGQSAVEIFKLIEPFILYMRKNRRNHAIYRSYERLVGNWMFYSKSNI